MSVTQETIMSDQQKQTDGSKDSEDLSQCSTYDTPGKGSDIDPEELLDEDAQNSEYGDGDADNDGDTPNVQPLDSSDEEKVPEEDHDDVDDQEDLNESDEPQEEEDDDDDGEDVIVIDKRQEGDGQESAPQKEKKLDDDEDRRNPQYIPKRGTFYEHDDRTADDMPESPKEGKVDSRDGKEPGKEGAGRKVWKEREDRWQHDRFQEMEQAPKSREELLMIYGYDIRNEEAPPKARRRRRYGRGPNKYTRSWEDEEAYSRPLSAFIVEKEGDSRRGRKPRTPRRGGGGGSSGGSSASAPGPRNVRKEREPRSRGRHPDSEGEEFPALTPTHKSIENGEEKKSAPHASFSSKVSGNTSASTVAGSFNMNPRDVVAPFGSQHKQRSDDDHRKSWRKDDSNSGDDRREPRGPPRGRAGRSALGRNRRDDDRDVQLNGQGRGRGRAFRRTAGTGRVEHTDDGSEPEVMQRATHEDLRKEFGNLTISKHQKNPSSQQSPQAMSQPQTLQQHQQISHQKQQQVTHPSSPSGDYQRRHSNGGTSSNGASDRRQNMPPRMQENSSSRPKRYSTVRPRNIPETTPTPTAVSAPYSSQPSHSYYQPGYGPGPASVQPMYADGTPAQAGHQPSVPPGAASPLLPTNMSANIPANIPASIPANIPVTLPANIPVTMPTNIPASMPTTMPTSMPNPLPNTLPNSLPCFPQAQFMAPPLAPPPGATARLLPPPGSFMPPGPAPPPPQTMNFVTAPAAQPQYQPLAFQTYQPITMVSGVSQPQPELYQPQGGITYYSTQSQNVPRTVPQPRVKAAIPIVPPPDRNSLINAVESEHDVIDMSHEENLQGASPPADSSIISSEASASS